VGMSEALQRAGLPLEGTHHRGGDEAWNPVLSEVEGIAGLLCQLLRRIREK
jgi:inhibitor of KinA sporulation pathway (predicted exonuclease)